MPLQFTWTGNNELERVGAIRWQCYSARGADLPVTTRRAQFGRQQQGDVCIATREGRDVGTATALSLHMRLRGQRLACQGVAWVGTSKAHRRKLPGEKGIASQVMTQIVNKARERNEVASALMPFRASFYEHFGFGVIERQHHWTIPLPVIDAALAGEWRFGVPADKQAMLACRARQCQSGHCDIDTSPAAMDEWFAGLSDDAQLFVDERDGIIQAYVWIRSTIEHDRRVARVVQPSWDSLEGLRSLLGLLGSLKDQYSFAHLPLPVDFPLTWLLKERQIPHRPVDHPAVNCQAISRMQVRILDSVRFLHGQTVVRPVSGKMTIAVKECEGHRSTFELDLADGVIAARPSDQSPEVELSDVTWAAIACGELRASVAWRAGLLDIRNDRTLPILDVLSEGPAPFCVEYF